MQGDREDRHGRMTRKTARSSGEADLSSPQGNNMMATNKVGEKGSLIPKNNGVDDCIMLEKACAANNRPKGYSVFAHAEEEERTLGNNLGVKRPHLETRSPRNERIQSPLSNQENRDPPGNAFVTARTKLVSLNMPISCG